MPASRLSVIAAGTALVGLLLYVIVALAPDAAHRKDFGFDVSEVNGRLIVSDVWSAGLAGLQRGDILLAWNGDAIAPRHAASFFYKQAPEPFALTVDRGGERRTFAITPTLFANRRQPARTISLALVAAAWAALGLTVIALRPNDRASRLCAAFMVLMAASQFGISIADIDRPVGSVQTWIRFAGFAAYPWHIVCAFLMACTLTAALLPFPLTLSQATIVAAAVIYTIGTAPHLLRMLDPTEAATIADVSRGWPGIIGRFVIVAGLVGTVASLAIGRMRAKHPVTRRRLGWMLGGFAPAAAAYSFSALLSLAARRRPWLGPLYDQALIVTQFLSLTVPLSFAYAVARHELFGIRPVIRMSIQYALARSALLWMLAIPVLGLAWTIWRQPDLTVRGLLSGTPHFYLLLVIAVSLVLRERLLAALDRRFFRDVRDRERILVDLASEIGRTETIEEATALAEQAVEASLSPRGVRVRLHEGTQTYPDELPTTDTLMRERLEGGEEITPESLTTRQDVAMVVPILNHERRLIGTLMLGPRRSEEPYSANDRNLLRAVARQIALAIDNTMLRREVGDERRIRHEVLSRLDKDAVHLIRECPACGAVFDHDVETCPADQTELILTLPIGRIIAGKYRLDRLIGRGGMGAVYEAADVTLDRLVAVKILQPEAFGDDAALRRFHREARILGSLSQPNVVKVHGYGTLSAGGAFLVMERLHGVTWRARLREKHTIDRGTLAVWLPQLCDALIAAHAKAVVHRDLKPENVIVREGDDQLKVLDFGIAKQTDGQGETEGTSMSGQVIGTLGYMAPEQLAGKPVDHRADIFAVGVMAWEAVCGHRPFQGSTVAELAIAMQNPPLDPPIAIDAGLRKVLEKALNADAQRRHTTALELKGSLLLALKQSK